MNNKTAADAPPEPSGELVTDWLKAVAARQERTSFARLYEYFSPKIKSYMIRQGADAAEADDLAQEAMVQVWRKAGQYNPDKAAPSTWIFRIARNLQIDRLRRRKFHEVALTAVADPADEGATGHERSVERIDANKLRGLIEKLPDDQLNVIRLAFFEGLSHSEIGQRLELPLGTVKSRLRLAYGKLRTALGSDS